MSRIDKQLLCVYTCSQCGRIWADTWAKADVPEDCSDCGKISKPSQQLLIPQLLKQQEQLDDCRKALGNLIERLEGLQEEARGCLGLCSAQLTALTEI